MRPRLLKRRGAPGYTLVEVVLAIVIAIGLLLVVLHFYRQAADLRAELIEETERISAARLVMDCLTGDLRCARNEAATGLRLSGDATSLRFVKAAAPALTAWTGGRLGRAAFAETDLRQVSYGLGSGLDGTNLVVKGLMRGDLPCVQLRAGGEGGRRAASAEAAPAKPAEAPEVFSEAIQHLRFRYWDGSQWSEAWNRAELPLGVEVTLGNAPPAQDESGSESSVEVFRRVIHLPGGSPSRVVASDEESTGSGPSAGGEQP